MTIDFWLLLFVLAGVVGFFADRTSICTVKAVEEVLTTRRAYMLLSFGKTAMWVFAVTVWLLWFLRASTPDPMRFSITWTGLAGGLLFGIGAVFNRGCALATLKRLGSGNLGALATLAGFAVGVAIFGLLRNGVDGSAQIRSASWMDSGTATGLALRAFATAWIVWELLRLWRTAKRQSGWTFGLASQLRLSTAAAIIGVSNGIIFGSLGTWSFTHTLRRSVEQLVATDAAAASGPWPMGLLWLLFLALVLGVSTSSTLTRRFNLAWRPTPAWQRFFGGGVLMGLGAAFVPGGNDVLLLNAIPGMSPHALPAYAAMLAGVVIGLVFQRWRGGRWDIVDCRDDLCRTSDGQQSY